MGPIYEERFTDVRVRTARDYVQLYRATLAPRLRAAGGEPLLLLTGLIGDRDNSILQVTRFPDMAAWQKAQEALGTERQGIVEADTVRLLRSVASRPKAAIPLEDRRECYSYRKLFISASDLAQFVEDSEKGVWPLYEAADCRVFGLFTTVAATNPLELVLMTGYHSPAHWWETRFVEGRPQSIDDKLWEGSRRRQANRGQLGVRGSWVRLWRPHEI
jgi:hypothetical protein